LRERYGPPSPITPQRPPAPEAIGAPATATVTTGIFEEEADQNPEAAIRSYQAVISGFDSQRANVANAIFRLGECYRKLGRMEEAKVQYARILREFTDLTRLVQISQQHLATPTPRPRPGGYGAGYSTGYPGAGGTTITPGQEGFTWVRKILVPATSSTPPVYSVQRTTTKEGELLALEIALVEQQILIVKKQIGNGMAAPEQLIPLQREILKLQRQMAALESVPETATAERPRTPEAALPKTSSLIGQSVEDPGDKTAMLKRQLGMAQSERMDAENRQIRTQTLLRMVKESDPVNLPEKAAVDPRYQELKKEYEKSVLAEDKAATEKASQRLSIWVKSIYLPELEAAEKATSTEVDTWQRHVDANANKLKDQQQEEEKRKQPATGRF
jgi:tetratricopeptide (TPR) repeat protein